MAGSQPESDEEDNTAEHKTWSPFGKPRSGVQGKCIAIHFPQLETMQH